MRKKNLFIVLGIIFLAGVVGGSYGLYLFFKKHRDLAGVKPDYQMPATQLNSAFEADEIAATKKYVNKVIEINGPVSQVELGSDSTVNVTISGPGAMSGVICSFQGRKVEDVNVKKGDIATIRGECSGVLLDVLLNNCALISKK